MAAGSYADHEALAEALSEHDRHERLAGLLRIAEAYAMADRLFVTVTQAAIRCGFPTHDPNARVLAWSRARVETFRRTFPRAA